jgi:hypothetical protein
MELLVSRSHNREVGATNRQGSRGADPDSRRLSRRNAGCGLHGESSIGTEVLTIRHRLVRRFLAGIRSTASSIHSAPNRRNRRTLRSKTCCRGSVAPSVGDIVVAMKVNGQDACSGCLLFFDFLIKIYVLPSKPRLVSCIPRSFNAEVPPSPYAFSLSLLGEFSHVEPRVDSSMGIRADLQRL